MLLIDTTYQLISLESQLPKLYARARPVLTGVRMSLILIVLQSARKDQS